VRACRGTGGLVLSGETFSGLRTGHSSSVGLPASASTSVRRAFGGLFEFTTCANGGLGRGLLRFDGREGFFCPYTVSCDVQKAVTRCAYTTEGRASDGTFPHRVRTGQSLILRTTISALRFAAWWGDEGWCRSTRDLGGFGCHSGLRRH
jgi:hypothetical protein